MLSEERFDAIRLRWGDEGHYYSDEEERGAAGAVQDLLAEIQHLQDANAASAESAIPCSDCNGQGWYAECAESTVVPEQIQCQRCLGTGWLGVSGRESALLAEVERLRADATLGAQMRALIPVGENLHLRVSWEVAEADSIVIVNSLTLERALRALVDLLPDSKEHFCQKPIEPPPGADWGTSYTPCDKCESCLAWQAAHDALAACECEEVGE